MSSMDVPQTACLDGLGDPRLDDSDMPLNIGLLKKNFGQPSVNLYSLEYNRRTPLHFAAEKGQGEIVDQLMELGDSIHVKEILDTMRCTPLPWQWSYNREASRARCTYQRKERICTDSIAYCF